MTKIPKPKRPEHRRAAHPGATQSQQASAASSLQQNFLPPGVLPIKDVSRFSVSEDKTFHLELSAPEERSLGSCTVSYAKVITGRLMPGMLVELHGVRISEEVLRLHVLLPVRAIKAHGPAVDHVDFETRLVNRSHHIPKTALAC